MNNPNDGIQLSSALFQNSPNPFSESTEIRYVLSKEANQGMINIYDMNGSQIRSYDLHTKGDAKILIDGGALNPGMYLYAMVVDGREVDIKRMILTE